MTKNWHAARNHDDSQGLVIDDETGANIAVTYQGKDAHIVAASPELLESLECLIILLEKPEVKKALLRTGHKELYRITLNRAWSVAMKAKGEY